MTEDGRTEEYDFIVDAMHVYRTTASHASHDEDEVGARWILSPALSDVHDMAVMGDLTVRTARMFAGVRSVALLELPWREEPLTDGDWPLADEILQAIAKNLTHLLYDFTATAMRTQVAGFGPTVNVSRATPPFELRLAGDANSGDVVGDLESQD